MEGKLDDLPEIAMLNFHKGDDNSPASFERSLSAIAKKISTANARLESSRQQSRRFNALWTLYTSIAYLLYSMIVVLVVGVKNSGIRELGILIGGPLLIYGVRQAIKSVYAYRTTSQQAYVNGLQKQRDVIIKRLKDATKYDSTQQLLDKYGGTPAKPKRNPSIKEPSDKDQRAAPTKNGRTMIIPPPTANIPRGPLSAPNASQDQIIATSGMQPPQTAAAITAPWPQQGSPISPLDESAEFAPNAFPSSNYYVQPGSEFRGSGHWYDRFMDVLLGEDESHPKNRIVLICKNCRLVNGQAPPGMKSLADIGKWRCSSCGTMNGEETEVQKIVAEIENENQSAVSGSRKIGIVPEEESSVLDQDGSDSDTDHQQVGDGAGIHALPTTSARETRSATARKSRKLED